MRDISEVTKGSKLAGNHAASSCSHSHSGSHSHSHGSAVDAEGRLKIVFWLNFIFAFVELVGGLWTQSLAVTSDALHDFGDSLALFLAYILEKKSKRRQDLQFSYGYRRLSTVAALITGTILLFGTGLILVTSIPRLWNPVQPQTTGMLWLSFLGIAVNGSAFLLMSRGQTLNEKMMRWHLLEDLMGWIVVLIGAIIMKYFDVPILDPLMAIGLSSYIAINVVRQMKPVINVFLMGVPQGFSIEQAIETVRCVPQVVDLHHVHVWSLDGEKHILTGHLVVKSGLTPQELLEVKSRVKVALISMNIIEVTLETESEGEICIDPVHHV